ncbi:hypothetical protein D7V97_20085 [Corallococcus sp. CA053C]|nr:hypothetical protein D7V97_20085 [Corallococcus sp. CA053C]
MALVAMSCHARGAPSLPARPTPLGAAVKMPDLSKLEFILHPMPVEVFLTEYWEKKVLHLRRNTPDYYRHLFSLGDLDSFLGHSLTNDEVRLARSGSVVAPRVEGEKKTTLYQFYEAYRTGYTPVVRNLHLCWEPIAEIASALALAFGCYISTHLYPTPENSQGFSAHWDDHDIFALQLEGAKEWRLYDSGPQLPRYSQERNDYARQRGPTDNPWQIINLEAGDLLYFPKGVVHEPRARTLSSLHLTYGLYPETWESLVTESLHEFAEREPRLQESLPFGFATSTAASADVPAQAAALAEWVATDARFEQAWNRLAAKVLDKTAPFADGHFARLGQATRLHAQSALTRRSGAAGVVVPSDAGAVLHYPGGTYSAPAGLVAALRFVAEHESFHVLDLPGAEDTQERLRLCRELIQVGFLREASLTDAR